MPSALARVWNTMESVRIEKFVVGKFARRKAFKMPFSVILKIGTTLWLECYFTSISHLILRENHVCPGPEQQVHM